MAINLEKERNDGSDGNEWIKSPDLDEKEKWMKVKFEDQIISRQAKYENVSWRLL